MVSSHGVMEGNLPRPPTNGRNEPSVGVSLTENGDSTAHRTASCECFFAAVSMFFRAASAAWGAGLRRRCPNPRRRPPAARDGIGWDGMGWDRTGQDRTGQDRIGWDRIGQDRTG